MRAFPGYARTTGQEPEVYAAFGERSTTRRHNPTALEPPDLDQLGFL